MVEEAYKVGALGDDDVPLYDLVNGLCVPPDGRIDLCVCLRGPSDNATRLESEVQVISDLKEKVKVKCFYDCTYDEKSGNACIINETNLNSLVDKLEVMVQENAKQIPPKV
jgi:hypothetical protein